MALVAVDIVGLSYREAGELLDTREATIATRVFRAREQLARLLGRERRTSDGAVLAAPTRAREAPAAQDAVRPAAPAPIPGQRRSAAAERGGGAAQGKAGDPAGVLFSEVSREA
ncbi:MAG TPA: sigma factor-like helix-turn-helix DNA-binding protein, partial [Solirubrobacteraceae bacterium]|nr:sigma factor-like helix-turn-helix DNA-binding protein [Solirubrobacteraceae bacterium]